MENSHYYNARDFRLPGRYDWLDRGERHYHYIHHDQTPVEATTLPAHHHHHDSYGLYLSYDGHQHPQQGYMIEHQPQIAYICSDCWIEYPDKAALDTHCCKCHLIFPSKASLKVHLVSHFNRRRHHRRRCRPTRSKRGKPYLHHHCSLCPASYRKKRQLRSHLRRHKFMIPCIAAQDCAWFFERPKDMIEHFDRGQCGSQMCLTRAYAREQQNITYGGPLARARAERWIGRYFEEHGKRPREVQQGSQVQVQVQAQPDLPVTPGRGTPGSASSVTLAASPLVNPADTVRSVPQE
ncbi:hypothetical protein M434DRAFT_373484 [Hypoxylon sp. CO27-5]|nr:hypothetical protein M434DRAFT_373484 [Hypoxylon sp. CO27-5]